MRQPQQGFGSAPDTLAAWYLSPDVVPKCAHDCAREGL
jgi:hypothetical protein